MKRFRVFKFHPVIRRESVAGLSLASIIAYALYILNKKIEEK